MFKSTKIIELGSCAFRQPKASSHCKYLHGYRLKAKFWFEADELDENNWVVDFGGLKELKKLLADQFDHTTCISSDDPHIEYFKKMRDIGVCDLRVMDGVGIEKFAEYCHAAADNFAQLITKQRCSCSRVEVFEHENNSAIFEPAKVRSTSTAHKAPSKPKKKKKTDAARVEKLVGNEKDLTQPPFKQTKNVVPPGENTGKAPPLKLEKQKNTWINPNSTWGF